jgi:hypothetical protein
MTKKEGWVAFHYFWAGFIMVGFGVIIVLGVTGHLQ